MRKRTDVAGTAVARGRWPALACCAFVVVLGLVAWYVVPLHHRRSRDR